jgi:DNA-binding CsgD family transcriptional regulator
VDSGADIRTQDLHRLCAVVDDAAHSSEPGRTLPRSVLEALNELVPCDEITYWVMDPHREIDLEAQDLNDDPLGVGPDDDPLTAFFWRIFWSSLPCSYPQQLGDFTSVRRATDFYSERELASSPTGEIFRNYGMRYETIVPLTPEGPIDHRIILWRGDGPDFSDRDQLLLTVLRPHLAEFELRRRGSRRNAALTSRQSELLHLVATGMTNRQIARRLNLSEGTVRRHLENIFERLGVNSRTAAAAYATSHAHRATANAHASCRTDGPLSHVVNRHNRNAVGLHSVDAGSAELPSEYAS